MRHDDGACSAASGPRRRVRTPPRPAGRIAVVTAPVLNQLNLVVADIAASIEFYRRFGLTVDAGPEAPHAEIAFPNGMTLELDQVDFVSRWDSAAPAATGGRAVIGLAVESRDEVDRLYAVMTEAGDHGHQPPYDAFWGARYAIVDDPDGYPVGIMSPIDPERRTWPPVPPPRAR